MSPRAGSPALPRLAAAMLLLLVGSLRVQAATSPYRQGDEVMITGRITDSGGSPVPGLLVRLEASQASVSVRKLGRVRRHATHVATRTDGNGEYSLEWSWHDFYNRFDLMAAVKVAAKDGVRLHELERQDISQRITLGSPVVVGLAIEGNHDILAAHREFVTGLASDDERRVFDEMGRPEQVDRIRLPRQEEVTWWYFLSGKAYRFEDGRLDQVVHFDPVEPF